MGPTLAMLALMALSGRPQDPSPKLGTVHFATSCQPATATPFDRSVALLHSFAFSPAIDGFNRVLAIDPRCAMAYWGLALAAWGNPFAAGIKPAAQSERGLDAVRRARAIGAPTEREREYVEAAAALYLNADSLDQRARLIAYRDAMKRLTAAAPADTEAAIFHALSMVIAADPADKSYASQLEAGATLDSLFAVMPDHPGLAHYLIHTYDVPPLAVRGLAAANRYASIAPALSHSLHMPSHTFTRVGFWDRSIRANIAAAKAARREGSGAEELHASDYQIYGYLQTGRDREAKALVSALPAIIRRFDPKAIGTGAPPAAGFFAMAAIPARYAMERGAWADAAALQLNPSPVPFADAMTHFARAIGAARSGDTILARNAIAELERIRDRLAAAKERYWSEQVEIQRSGAAAWLLFALDQRTEALAAMRAAADREDATEKNAITPGPLAPARELLGEMLLASDQPVAALAAFEHTIEKEPNRFRTLIGAARSAARAGRPEVAHEYYRALRDICRHADRPGRPELAEVRRP